jgi:OOP family OmpA-OmpF porin
MKIYITSLLLIFSVALSAQTNNEYLKLGDAAMASGQYSNAVYYYGYTLFKIEAEVDNTYYPYEISTKYETPTRTERGAIEPPKNPTPKEINVIHKLALAYLKTDDFENSEIWFKAAVDNPLDSDPNARYHYGLALMANEKYEAAAQQFELFQEEIGDENNRYYRRALDQLANCQFALNPTNTNDEIGAFLMDSTFNAGSTSLGIQFTSDKHVLYSSARIDPNAKFQAAKRKEEMFLLDLYIVNIDERGNYGTPEQFPFSVSAAEYHNGSAVLSPDGYSLFFTKMNPENTNETEIYVSKKFNNTWMQPFPMDKNVNAEGSRSMTPFYSEIDSSLYFASTRPGGLGGLDLWRTKITANGETVEPQNLGPTVNTPFDEFAPFIHLPSLALYYSSGGHIGFGGQDIFVNKWNLKMNSFEEAINAGAPVNSSRDDSYFVLNEKQDIGYVTSNRETCEDCDSIYNLKVFCNKLYEVRKPALKFSVRGYVYDKNTNEVLPHAKIDFKDVSYYWEHFSIEADENGYYEQDLIPNLELFMKASLLDYFADKAIISNVNEIESKIYEQDFYLERIPDKEITIEGIEYDFDKATIRPESAIILDRLIEFLELNSNLKIEIRSHTDIRGEDAYNYALSERRAQSVVDYLTAHGISIERLIPQGYGETLPAEVPDKAGNMVTLTPAYIQSLPWQEREEAHQRNRRTAFFVLDQNQ